ncbi:MAG: RDD family protein [Sterolibacterium sp.]|nr:RDD family protein [Sterolibacterium sp.]MBP9800031.1 RDD family protein [Sterolibacterium sp.]
MTERLAPGLPRRLASMVYELLLLLAVVAALVLLPHTLYAMHAQTAAPTWLLQAHLTAVLAGYFIGFWHLGQTLAMKTWKFCLRDASTGGRVSMARAALRHLLAWLSLGLAGLGVLWALFDRHGQFLHDRLAGTCLIPVSDALPTTASRRPPAGTSRLA